MNLNVVLEIAMGLALMYLLLSLLVTAVNELIAQFSGIRARHLESALRQMLKLKPEKKDEENLKLFDSLFSSPTFQIAGSVAKTHPLEPEAREGKAVDAGYSRKSARSLARGVRIPAGLQRCRPHG